MDDEWPWSDEGIQRINSCLRRSFDSEVLDLINRAVARAMQKKKAFVGVEDLVLSLTEEEKMNWPADAPPLEVVLEYAREQENLRWNVSLEKPVPSWRLGKVLQELGEKAEREGRKVTYQELFMFVLRDSPVWEEWQHRGVRSPFAPPDLEWEEWLRELRSVQTIAGQSSEDLSSIVEHLGIRPAKHPALGREQELEELRSALNASSVLVVGPSRVGKTFLIEELARRLWRKERRRVARIALYRLEAGSGIVGVFEKRIEAIFGFALKHNVILFLDEFEAALGTGVAWGRPQGFATYLLQEIDRGVRLIASLTEENYNHLRTHRQAKALLGRFTVFRLKEVKREDLPLIFKSAIRGHPIDDSAISAVLELGDRFLRWQPQPAKGLRWLALAAERLPPGAPVSKEAVVQAVGRELNVPYYIVKNTLDKKGLVDKERLKKLLTRNVQGQDSAIKTVVDAIDLYCSPVGEQVVREQNPFRPRVTFLFVGPPGTGKTLLAKTLAEHVFGKDALIQFDMGNIRGMDGRRRLLGDLPNAGSYRGELAMQLEEKPCSVVLFDEFHHAPEHFELLLPILHEGRVTTNQGEIVYFSDAIIILTANIKRKSIIEVSAEVNTAEINNIKEAYAHVLPLPLLDRIDRVVEFKELTLDDLESLIEHKIARLNERILRFFGIECIIDQSARHALAQLVSQGVGAREVDRVLEEHVVKGINDLLSREAEFRGTVWVTFVKGGFQFIPQRRNSACTGIS